MSNEEMIKVLAENTQRSKSNAHRIDALEHSFEALNKMATALEVLAAKQNGIAEQVDKIETKLCTLENKPLKRFYSLLGYVVAAICSAGAGVLFGFYF